MENLPISALFNDINKLKKSLETWEEKLLKDTLKALQKHSQARLLKLISKGEEEAGPQKLSLSRSRDVELHIERMSWCGYHIMNADLEIGKDLLELRKSSNGLIFTKISGWRESEDWAEGEDWRPKRIVMWWTGTKWNPKINTVLGKLSIGINTQEMSKKILNSSWESKEKFNQLTTKLADFYKENVWNAWVEITMDVTTLLTNWIHKWESVFTKKFDRDWKVIDDALLEKVKKLFKWYIDIDPTGKRSSSGSWKTYYSSIEYTLIRKKV